MLSTSRHPVAPLPVPLPRKPPRVLLYSHDTFGLGNIRRTLLLAEAIKEEYPEAAVLMLTGSPMVHAYRIPDGVDYIKLPCLDRTDADRYQPRFLNGEAEKVTDIRRAVLERAICSFAPDLLIVDKRAGGVDGELLTSLRALRDSPHPCRVVLGIRDILDSPERTRQSLARHRDLEILEDWYDEVWIYGSRDVFDAVTEYGFPDAVAAKTRYCGYLRRPVATRLRQTGPPRVLVTTGGGGDGSDMIHAYLEGLLSLPRRVELLSTIVFGPQMPDACREALRQRFGGLPDVTLLDFDADMTSQYADADVVVSMAGYNTVCELLSLQKAAVLVPRREPVAEQLIRARLLAARGCFEVLDAARIEPDVLIAKVLSALAAPVAPVGLDMSGLTAVRGRVRALLEGEDA